MSHGSSDCAAKVTLTFVSPNLLLPVASVFAPEISFRIHLVPQTRNWGTSPDTSSSPVPTPLLGELFERVAIPGHCRLPPC